ncbi:hypothetical protein TRAPUB_7298 [Trametes pubescens]|uniref:Uncharacterized protein n=1 Tax=Trametes pubescens TaxID=154538 RepID=A0A1M2V3M8_TRAPU|nr:hypothetical protein TRAPUB_7298 [Trametes pubescens]
MQASAVSAIFDPKGPSSSTAEEWVVKQDKCGAIIVQGRNLLPFVCDLTDKNITSLHLRLDHSSDNAHTSEHHNHRLYSIYSDDYTEDFPNKEVEKEIVQVCHALRGTLAHLSISMCKPELMISHLPCFVYEILAECPGLQSLSLEDVQCAHFGEDNYTDDDVTYLEAIAMNDQQPVWCFQFPPQLHTLVISKRSVAHWREPSVLANPEPAHVCPSCITQSMAMQKLTSSQVTTTAYGPYGVRTTGVQSLRLAVSKQDEAQKLAALMMENIPSLKWAYVMLDKGTVNLKIDRDGRYETVTGLHSTV